MGNQNKSLVIYSILKWFTVVWATLAEALVFVDMANYSDGTNTLAFLLMLPVVAYMWSLVARKIT